MSSNPSNQTRPSVEMREGGYYKNGLGDIITIKDERECGSANTQVFIGSDNHFYRSNGERVHGERAGPFDLIEEITEADFKEFMQSVQHPEIPLDDWEIARAEFNCLYPHSIGYIGPHEGRHFNLLLSGLKPCAIIGDVEWCDRWVEFCKTHQFEYEETFEGSGEYYVYRLDEKWRVLTLKYLDATFPIGRGEQEDYSIMIGRLLGYRQSDIDFFIQRAKKLHEW
jgi:hypothetical protein